MKKQRVSPLCLIPQYYEYLLLPYLPPSPFRKPEDKNQVSDFSAALCTQPWALHQLEPCPCVSPANVQDRNQYDATAYSKQTVLGIGVEFGEGNSTMHLHRRESGLISFANAAWAAALITVPFNFPLLSESTLAVQFREQFNQQAIFKWHFSRFLDFEWEIF